MDRQASRTPLMADRDLLLDWGSARAKDRDGGQGNLFDLMAPVADTDGPADLSHAPKASPVPDYPPTEKLRLEKDLVGFYLSDHPLKQLTPSSKLLAPIGLGSLEEQPDKAKVSAIAMVAEMRQVTTRKGDRMAIRDHGRIYNQGRRLRGAFRIVGYGRLTVHRRLGCTRKRPGVSWCT